jgi:hypothetical protein
MNFLMIYWAFYRSTVTVNFAVSFTVSFVTLMLGFIPGCFTVFAVSLITAGLFLAFMYKEVVCPQEYYFYYNRGISKIKLILFCFFVNALPSALILIIVASVDFMALLNFLFT